jgi:hypothetical protein
VTKLATQIANPDLLREVAKVNTEALELSRDNLVLQHQVAELETKIKELRAQLDLRAKTYRLYGYIFVDGDPDPHCPTCWEEERKLIHMRTVDGWGRCPRDKNHYVPRDVPNNPHIDHSDAIPV